jgi:methionyl-tRNA synthetase
VAAEALVAVLEAARVVALVLAPVTPRISARMLQQLGLDGAAAGGWGATAWGALQQGHATPAPAPVFARLDEEVPWVTQPAPAAAAAGGGKQQQQPQQQQQLSKRQQQRQQKKERKEAEAQAAAQAAAPQA